MLRLQAVAVLGLEKLNLPLLLRHVFKLAKQLISLSPPDLSIPRTKKFNSVGAIDGMLFQFNWVSWFFAGSFAIIIIRWK